MRDKRNMDSENIKEAYQSAIKAVHFREEETFRESLQNRYEELAAQEGARRRRPWMRGQSNKFSLKNAPQNYRKTNGQDLELVSENEKEVGHVPDVPGISNYTVRHLAAVLVLLVLVAGVFVGSGAYARVSDYVSRMWAVYSGRYEKNLNDYEKRVDIRLESEYSVMTIEDVVVSKHSLIFKVIGKAKKGITKEGDFLPGAMGLKATWKDGTHVRYDEPLAQVETGEPDEYILVYGAGDDIQGEASSVESFRPQKVELAFLDQTLSEHSEFKAFTLDIDKCYSEKEVSVDQTLQSPGKGAIQVKKVIFNGMFWGIYYEVKGKIGENDEFGEVDENGFGEMYDLVAVHDQKEWRGAMLCKFSAGDKDRYHAYYMLAVNEDEDLEQISLYYRIYEAKGLDVKAEDKGLSKEHLDIRL